MKARVALYGYPVISSKADYIAEYYECSITQASPRIFIETKCREISSRIGENTFVEAARDISLRLVTGTEAFTYLLVTTVPIAGRKEKYVEVRKIETDKSIDISVLNAYSLGISTNVMLPEIPAAILDDSLLQVISAAIIGESKVIHVPSEVKALRRIISLLKYIPSYVIQKVKLDVGGKISDDRFMPDIKVLFVADTYEIGEIEKYSKYLAILEDPDPLRDYVDSLLYQVKPEKPHIKYVVDAATVLYLAKYYRRSKAIEETDENSIRGFALLSKSLTPSEIKLIARLSVEKRLEEKLLELSNGAEEIISALLMLAYEREEHSIRIARSIFKYDQELAIILLADLCKRGYTEEVSNTFIRFVTSGIDFEKFSEAGLAAFLYLLENTKIPENLVKPLVPSFVKRAISLYKEILTDRGSLFVPNVRPTLTMMLPRMFATLPLPDKIEVDEETREIIREFLEDLSNALRYSRYELKVLFENYYTGSGVILPVLSRESQESIREFLLELRKSIASDREYKDYLVVPRRDRVEAFAPELSEIFDKIDKNIQELRSQIKSYIEKGKRKRPKEGEG